MNIEKGSYQPESKDPIVAEVKQVFQEVFNLLLMDEEKENFSDEKSMKMKESLENKIKKRIHSLGGIEELKNFLKGNQGKYFLPHFVESRKDDRHNRIILEWLDNYKQ